MITNIILFLVVVVCFLVFAISFRNDRSRYRNCYFLFGALVSLIPFTFNVFGKYGRIFTVILMDTILFALLIVPFFLIFNGCVMIKKEGKSLAHLLSLLLGIIVLVGEVIFVILLIMEANAYTVEKREMLMHSWSYTLSLIITTSIIYASMTVLIFIIYILLLQLTPRKKKFNYIIIHGSGLINGSEIPKLLRSRIDKAISIYESQQEPPIIIPSGGKGDDESISEAEAIKKYLLENNIPEDNIVVEDKSTTTYENLANSKQIIDSYEGEKCVALVSSNYHIYRALRYARKIGLKCTGIGSRTAFYYWPSAVLREYIAIHTEKKHLVIFILGWMSITLPAIKRLIFK